MVDLRPFAQLGKGTLHIGGIWARRGRHSGHRKLASPLDTLLSVVPAASWAVKVACTSAGNSPRKRRLASANHILMLDGELAMGNVGNARWLGEQPHRIVNMPPQRLTKQVDCSRPKARRTTSTSSTKSSTVQSAGSSTWVELPQPS